MLAIAYHTPRKTRELGGWAGSPGVQKVCEGLLWAQGRTVLRVIMS